MGFFKIIGFNYSDEEIGILNWWADEMFAELDAKNVDNLVHSMKVFDWEEEWDFPDAPEIC